MTENEDFHFPVLDVEFHRACGIVKGCITQLDKVSKSAWLVCPDGQTYESRVINSGAEKFANRGWQTLLVYPVYEKKLILEIAYPRKDEPPDRYFEVQGVVTGIYKKTGEIEVSIWSCNGNSLRTVRVNGYLPAQRGQVWWLQCELDSDGLFIIDGKKIAAKWSPPEGFDHLRVFKMVKRKPARVKARRLQEETTNVTILQEGLQSGITGIGSRGYNGVR